MAPTLKKLNALVFNSLNQELIKNKVIEASKAMLTKIANNSDPF